MPPTVPTTTSAISSGMRAPLGTSFLFPPSSPVLFDMDGPTTLWQGLTSAHNQQRSISGHRLLLPQTTRPVGIRKRPKHALYAQAAIAAPDENLILNFATVQADAQPGDAEKPPVASS